MRYQPGQSKSKPVVHDPWPVWGERFSLNGETWVVALFEPSMNMVEIAVTGFGRPAQFFTIADWKRMWSA